MANFILGMLLGACAIVAIEILVFLYFWRM
jgi:hypothetical protein